jgi:hypothetical protein
METLLIGSGLVVLGLFVWIYCVVMAYRQAPKRGRRPGVWAALTVVFGPLALFAMFVLPRRSGGARR